MLKMRRCEICGTPYMRGTMVDIGVGFIQVSEDEPACHCYEEGDFEVEKYCETCHMSFLPSESYAEKNSIFCSTECEEGD